MVRAADMLAIALQLDKEMYACVSTSYYNSKRDLDFIRLNAPSWEAIHPNSFDYAFMEKSSHMGCVPYSEYWSDLGDWNAVVRESETDPDGNTIQGHAIKSIAKTQFYGPIIKIKCLQVLV